MYKYLLSDLLQNPTNQSPLFPIDMSFSSTLRQLPKGLASLIPAALIASNTVLGGSLSTCENPQLSCRNTTAVADTCCFNAPGGQLLLTQFWDTNPPTGPNNSWTIHGLW